MTHPHYSRHLNENTTSQIQQNQESLTSAQSDKLNSAPQGKLPPFHHFFCGIFFFLLRLHCNWNLHGRLFELILAITVNYLNYIK